METYKLFAKWYICTLVLCVPPLQCAQYGFQGLTAISTKSPAGVMVWCLGE